jgi:hypothetical protein
LPTLGGGLSPLKKSGAPDGTGQKYKHPGSNYRQQLRAELVPRRPTDERQYRLDVVHRIFVGASQTPDSTRPEPKAIAMPDASG